MHTNTKDKLTKTPNTKLYDMSCMYHVPRTVDHWFSLDTRHEVAGGE